jgi:hypothetical protein
MKMKKLFFVLALLIAMTALSKAQYSATINGPATAGVGYWNTYTVSTSGVNVNYYDYQIWNINAATFTYEVDYPETGVVKIKPTSEGSAILWISLIDGEARYPNLEAYLIIDAEVYVPPSYIPPPTISGPSTDYEGTTAAYSMPSGKQAYEWILPFYGVTHVQQYNNIKVVYFENVPGSGQQRTIQGRYKVDGEWSEYGSKTTIVY